MMADVELDSFIMKFKSISRAGFKASLKAETADGIVSVSLTASLGHLSYANRSVEKYRSPSYSAVKSVENSHYK